MSNVFDVAKSINIKQVYERYSGINIPQHRNRGNVSCPFHDDSKPSMHLYEKTNTFFCFSCKKSGTSIDLYKEILGVADDLEAAKDLCKDFNLTYDTYQVNPAYKDYTDVYTFVAKFYNYLLHTSLCPDSKYFENRLLGSLEKDYLLGYCPSIILSKDNRVFNFKSFLMKNFPNIEEVILDSYGLYDSKGDSIMSGRYVFTIFDSKGNPVAFSGRSIDPDNPAKYLNTSDTTFFKKRYTLYNYHKAKKYGSIYIVEGYCDALALINLGYENVVAIMGTSFTEDHINLLKEKEIILSLDNDNAGKLQMYNLIKSNKTIPFKVLSWSGAKDFNDLLISDTTKFVQIFNIPTLISAPEYLIRYLKDTLDLTLLTERDKFWVEVASLIGANDKRYLAKYPVNTTYTPVSYDYYWTVVKRIIKGKRGL